MQASDYRYVDVTGVSIADKILPKIYDSSGGAKVERAEDLAFLWEAVSERQSEAAWSMPIEFRRGTRSPGAINGIIRSMGAATYAGVFGPRPTGLASDVQSSTRPPPEPHKSTDYSGNVTWTRDDGWFDWSKVGIVVRKEYLDSEAFAKFDITSVFPDIFTDVSVPSDNGRFSDCRIMVDPLRYLYSRLAHAEGYVAWHDVTTRFDCTLVRTVTVGKGTGADTTETEEHYGLLGSGSEVGKYWFYQPELTNEYGEVVSREEWTLQDLDFTGGGAVTYSGGTGGLSTDIGGTSDIPVMLVRFRVHARTLDNVETDKYIVDYLNTSQGWSALKGKIDDLFGKFKPRTNYVSIYVETFVGPFLFPFSGKTKLRDLAGGVWDPA